MRRLYERGAFEKSSAKPLVMGFAKLCVIFDGQAVGLLRQHGSTEAAERAAVMEGRVNEFGWTAQIIQHEVDHCNGILI